MSLSQYIKNLQEEKKQRKIKGMQEVLPYLQNIYNIKNQEYLSDLAQQEKLQKRQQDLEDFEIKENIKQKTNLNYSPLHNQQNIENEKQKLKQLQPLKNEISTNQAINKGIAERKAFTEFDNQNDLYKHTAKKEIDNQFSEIKETNKKEENLQNDIFQYQNNLTLLNDFKFGNIDGKDKVLYQNKPFETNSEIGKKYQQALLKKQEFESKYPAESAKIFLENTDIENDYKLINNYHMTSSNRLRYNNTKKNIKDKKLIADYKKAQENVKEYENKFNNFLKHEINIENKIYKINDFYNEFKKRNLLIQEYNSNFNNLDTQQKFNAIIKRLPGA